MLGGGCAVGQGVRANPMTEDEWNRCTDPQAMLTFLRDSGKLSERKARLFAVACCRRVLGLLTRPSASAWLNAGEGYAEGEVTHQECERTLADIREAEF